MPRKLLGFLVVITAIGISVVFQNCGTDAMKKGLASTNGLSGASTTELDCQPSSLGCPHIFTRTLDYTFKGDGIYLGVSPESVGPDFQVTSLSDNCGRDADGGGNKFNFRCNPGETTVGLTEVGGPRTVTISLITSEGKEDRWQNY